MGVLIIMLVVVTKCLRLSASRRKLEGKIEENLGCQPKLTVPGKQKSSH